MLQLKVQPLVSNKVDEFVIKLDTYMYEELYQLKEKTRAHLKSISTDWIYRELAYYT